MDGALPAFDLALSPQLRFILDLGAALALALVGGAIAVRLGQPAVIGYVAAGMAIGPFTPGLTADPAQISALAEVGVVLVLGYEARVSRSGDEAAMVALEPPTEGATVGLALPRSEGQGLPGLPAGRRTIVVLGAGWVGRLVIAALRARDFQVIVVDRDPRRLEEAARLGAVTIYGDAAHPEILRRTGLERAQLLVVALGDPLTTRLAVERARRLSPDLQIAARARGRRQIRELRAVGVPRVADPEAEAAFELARHALQRMGVSGPELNAIVVGLRRQYYGP